MEQLTLLKTMLKDFNYDETYDFEDMKLAVVCADFVDNAIELDGIIYEDIFTLASWVKALWLSEFKELSFHEQGYIQEYARRILNENINEIETILRRESDEEI